MSDFCNFSLDDDCLLHIFSYLSYTELEASGLVCQEWLRIARANLLWKGVSAHFYIPNDFDETFESDYRRLYKFKVRQDDYWLKSQYITSHPIVHDHSVRGVAFSSVAPDLLASCGYDSAVHVYKLNSFPAPIRSFKTLFSGIYSSSERLSRVKWTCNGEHLVVTSSTVGGLYYYDAEHSVGPLKFFKRVSSGRLDRTALATHPKFPYLVAVAGDDEEHREGGDVSLVDVRVPGGPVRIMRGLHRNTVRDIEWHSEDQILTASPDGTVKISTLEGRTHTTIQVTARIEAAVYDGALSATCVQVGETEEERQRHVAVGCSGIVQLWDIKEASNPVLLENFDTCNNYLPVWRLKYNKRGTLLFVASDDGFVAMYSRKRVNGEYRHQFIGNVLSHSNDVSDLDISLNEDHVASASQSREVGLASLIPISTI